MVRGWVLIDRGEYISTIVSWGCNIFYSKVMTINRSTDQIPIFLGTAFVLSNMIYFKFSDKALSDFNRLLEYLRNRFHACELVDITLIEMGTEIYEEFQIRLLKECDPIESRVIKIHCQFQKASDWREDGF